jgi:hypothetical protein
MYSNKMPQVDWSQVRFPSDEIPLGVVRQIASNDPEELGDLISRLLTQELQVANHAATHEIEPAGEQRRLGGFMLEADGLDLGELYIQIGLAKGRHEAKHLVDKLVATARAQVSGKAQRARE